MPCLKHQWWKGEPDDCPGCEVESHNIAVDAQGHLLPYSHEDVGVMSEAIIRKGKLLLSVWLMPDNDIAIRVEGPPSQKVYDVLKRAVEGYGLTVKRPE